MIKIFKALIFISVIVFALPVFAKDNVTDWYIKDFQTVINVQEDSSIEITETILADCGQNQRHGIFRILPTRQELEGSSINSPITLESITDQGGRPYKYQTTNDKYNHTVTWKIGDANKFVTGENTYIIKYRVKNAIRHNSQNFDELYWNLNGNFWELETDSFEATINFPKSINQNNLNISTYIGAFGQKNDADIYTEFTSANTLQVKYPKPLGIKEGITLSASFPKGLVQEYKPSFGEKYGSFFFLIIPLVIFWLCLKLWRKFGDDPSINPTIAPEFEIPEKLAPIEMGILQTDGLMKNNFITASIINLAVNGRIKIKLLEKKGLLGKDDFELAKLESKYKPSNSERELLEGIFESGSTIQMSSLQNKFYKHLPKISKVASDYLAEKGFLVHLSRLPQWIMLFIGIFVFFFSVIGYSYNTLLGISLSISGIIFIIFSFVMPRRTLEGAELLRKVKGFRLYLDKVERYRQQVLEKQNTFEKMLPYAILFGMTKEYVRKMKSIYGEKYFDSYHPAWFYYAGTSNFNVDSFGSQISSISGQMASTISSTPSSSGYGGGGFSGGGGGGGGGGGW